MKCAELKYLWVHPQEICWWTITSPWTDCLPESEVLIATHCESERIIRENMDLAFKSQNRELTAADHPLITERGCLF